MYMFKIGDFYQVTYSADWQLWKCGTRRRNIRHSRRFRYRCHHGQLWGDFGRVHEVGVSPRTLVCVEDSIALLAVASCRHAEFCHPAASRAKSARVAQHNSATLRARHLRRVAGAGGPGPGPQAVRQAAQPGALLLGQGGWNICSISPP